MMISTKGRYALRVMIDLARQDGGGFTPLKDISARQEISQKYLESICLVLSNGGLVDARHGKGGGYRLNRTADEISVGEILRLCEGSLAPVACLKEDAEPCERSCDCPTRPVFDKLNSIINDYLDGVTLASLLAN